MNFLGNLKERGRLGGGGGVDKKKNINPLL